MPFEIHKMKRFLFILAVSLFLAAPAAAAEHKVYVSFFYGDGCPHCSKEEKFLDRLEKELPYLEVKRFEVWNNRENALILQKLGEKFDVRTSGVPIVFIGNEAVNGYLNDETTGRKIRAIIEEHFRRGFCQDVVDEILCEEAETQEPESQEDTLLTIPILGQIDTKSFSLPVLTIIIAGLDGFNPCAMWVLLFLISLLLGMKDRKRMWILGGTFIAASSLVYFLFLTAWLNVFLFLGFILWVRILIGLVAVGSGGYHLREYFVNKEGACKVTGGEKRQKVFEKLREIVGKKEFLAALVGIILLAFAVNLVELVCSAGLPAVYTQVLALASLPRWQYYLYLLLYILIFMLDDLFVFVLAMKTLYAVGLSTKYSRYSNLIGGVVIFILGILLLFKPELIMFG